MEIYIHDASTDAVLRWLKDTFDAVERIRDEPAVQVAITGADETAYTAQITRHVEGGPWTSVWFESGATDWESVTACARSAFQAINRETLCYPDRFADEPWKMLRLHPDEGESFVDERTVNFSGMR
jgi:hypothetical protein